MSKHFNLTKIKLLTYHLLTALTLMSQGWGTESDLTQQDQKNAGPRILVADDDPIFMSILKASLKNNGFGEEIGFGIIRTATDGLMAFNIYQSEDIDVVISDNQMLSDKATDDPNGEALIRKIVASKKYQQKPIDLFIQSSEKFSPGFREFILTLPEIIWTKIFMLRKGEKGDIITKRLNVSFK